jgi:predicted ATP-grasp superfamily ATP-dependent carboligase
MRGIDPAPRFDALVADAALRQSLVAVRSLGRRGLRVAALEVESHAEAVPTFSSRWCDQALIAPAHDRDASPFVEYLERWLVAHRPRVLIASSDLTVDVVRRHRPRLDRHARIALARDEALAVAANKDRTLAVARALGIAVPRGVPVSGVAEVPSALRELGLPVVVKPVESWVHGAARPSVRVTCKLATTVDETMAAVDELTRLGGVVLLQEFLTGEREAVSLLYAGGQIHARFAQWAKRMQPPLGGMSVFRKSIAVPHDLGDAAERLVRAIDLEGYSEVEFRRDAAGKPRLMEINARLSASVEVAVRAGVDFPHLLYQWASGERIARVTGYRVGRWMRFLRGDFVTTMESVAQRGRPGVAPPLRALFDFTAAFFVPSGYDYFAWNDLAPGWTAARDFGRLAVRYVIHTSFKRAPGPVPTTAR